jgi:uncharacterized protein
MAAEASIPGGRRPWPFEQFIVKIHSRCNLACDYCYVYTMADQRWRSRPKVMSREIIDHTADRIAEHARAHALPSVQAILHGGEPLLAGPDTISYLVSRFRSAVRDSTELRFGMQTNGMLLDRDMLTLLRKWGIRVSVSIDGDARGHDRHRRTHGGAGTYGAVSAALRELATGQFRSLFGGLLCTIDLRNDPLDTYRALLEFGPPAVDFLLPHGNWTTPPPGRVAGSARTPYADWLIAVFDSWYAAAGNETSVRLFEEIINAVLGGASRVEGVGLSPALMVVVETDGTIEQADVLASTYEGAAATGLHVRRDSFDAVLDLPRVRARQLGATGLPLACRECPVRAVCGGGLEAHRYRAGHGFDNPSVYCPDLFRLIGHVRDRLAVDVAALRTAAR